MTLPLDDIETKALAATPGPWEACGHDVLAPIVRKHGQMSRLVVADVHGEDSPCPENAAFIAAVSPDVVLAMVAEIRRLRDGLQEADELLDRLAHPDIWVGSTRCRERVMAIARVVRCCLEPAQEDGAK